MKILIIIGLILMQAVCYAQNLDSELVAYYPFNGNANDESGNGNHGLVSDAILINDKNNNINSAFYYNGRNSYLQLNHNQIYQEIEKQQIVTITCWVNIYQFNGTSNFGFFPIIEKTSSFHDKDGWSFQLNEDGISFVYGCDYYNLDYLYQYHNYSFNLNQWYFVCLRIDLTKNIINFFINCDKVFEQNLKYKIHDTQQNPLFIGYSPIGPEEYSNGIIDELRIYNRALTDFEIQMLSEINITLQIPNIIVNVGTENFHIPIKAKLNCQNMLADNLSFTAKIRFNASTFYPTGLTKGKIIENTIDNNLYRNLTIQCDSVNISDTDSILTEIVGTVLLGDSLTPIEILEFKWINSNIEIDTIINGSLLTRACALPIRRIQLFTPTIIQLQPNPANDEIEIEIKSDEEGLHVLNLYNIQGIKVDSQEWLNEKKGKSELTFKLNDYPSGVYYIVLKSPCNVISKPLIVIK